MIARRLLWLLLPTVIACSSAPATPPGGVPDGGVPDGGGPRPRQGAQISDVLRARGLALRRALPLRRPPQRRRHRRRLEGAEPPAVGLIGEALALVARDARGFALAGAVYFRASAALDPATLPSMAASVADGASVFVVGVDPAQPDYRVRRPIDVAFLADGGPFGDENLLAALPLQGAPLRPSARYAAVVTRAVHDAAHLPLAPSPEMAALAAGKRPDGLSDGAFAEYTGALSALAPLVPAERDRRARRLHHGRPDRRRRRRARRRPRRSPDLRAPDDADA